MNKHFLYLKYVIRHKWFVFLACVDLGIPLQGIVHDLSKFRPSEWFAYVEYFYGDWRKGNKDRQAVAPPVIQMNFERAWNHHQKRNPHHWQYWMRLGDDRTILAIEMPLRYAKEMLADWHGAGRAITGRYDTHEWYAGNSSAMILNSHTRTWIELKLRLI